MCCTSVFYMGNPPISKQCSSCKEEKLLAAFELNLSSKSKDKHESICKSCVEGIDQSEQQLGCCQGHFEQFVIDSTIIQLDANLQMVELLQESGVEIPTELSQKMFNTAHRAGMRCKYDSCSRELEHKDS